MAGEPLFGLPGLRLHLLVGHAVAYVGGPLPRLGSGLGVVKSRTLGQPCLGRVQRRPRLPGSPLNRPHPDVVHGKADDPLMPGLLDNLWGEVGHPLRGCLVSSRLR